MFKLAADLDDQPAHPRANPSWWATVMFSNRKVEKFDDRAPEVLARTWPRIRACSRSAARSARGDRRRQAGSQDRSCSTCATPSSKPCCYRFAIDPTMVAFGEENRDWGGAFARLSRADRSAAVPPPLQFADFRSGHRRRGRGLRARRRARGGGADVRRFHGPRRRRDFQPACQVAGDVGRATDHAGGAAHFRGREVRRAAFAGLDRPGAPHSGAEGGLPGDAVRRQGHDERGAGRHRPGGLFRKPEALRLRRDVRGGGRAGRLLRNRTSPSPRSSGAGTGSDHHHPRPRPLHAPSPRPTSSRAVRAVRRSDRPARRQPAQLRARWRNPSARPAKCCWRATRWSAAA